MFPAFYRYFYGMDLHSIICFALIAVFLFLLHGPKNKKINLRRYVLLNTASFIALYTGVLALHRGSLLFITQERPFAYYYLVNLFLALLWSSLLLRGGFFPKVTYSLFFFAAIHLYNTATSPLYLRSAAPFSMRFMLLDLLTKFGLYILLAVMEYVFRRYRISGGGPLDPACKVASLTIPLSILAGDVLIMFNNDISVGAPILAAIILFNLPFIYLLIARVIASYAAQQHLQENMAQLEVEAAEYRKTVEMREILRQERHELKGNYFLLQTLLHQQQYDELDRQLKRIAGELNDKLQAPETGSTFLNYLLSKKIELARSKQIPLSTEILLPTNYSIDEYACGAILSNLLDNAIEASEKEAYPDICVSMRAYQGYFRCQVSNRVSTDVLALNPSLKTTKEDENAHGYGLRVIKHKLHELDGLWNVSVQNGRFIATFMIPMTKQRS